ncbi:MAG: RsmD family RNA methyltransferase [Formosimonas sp.]
MKPAKKPHHIRIIGGEYRRTQLEVLNHDGLRPSSDRVRETVFNWMMHQWGGQFAGKRVLDAFAGSGAFGLECVSRGASDVLLLDTHAPAVVQIQKVLHKWQADEGVCARVQDVSRLEAAPFDWIILDPPFGQGWLNKIAPMLTTLAHSETFLYVEVELAADTRILSEHGWVLLRSGTTQQVNYSLWQRIT